MGIGVLGPLTVEGSTAAINRRDRVVLEALAAHRGHVLSPAELADAVWGDQLPASWNKNLQSCVVRLRRLIGRNAIETRPEGYRLVLGIEQVDAGRFERMVHRARELLDLGDADRACYMLDEALDLWRGDALADLVDWDRGRIEAERLNELRLDAEELRLDAALRSGEHGRVLADMPALVRAQPLRERRWALLALAQYQAGRQGESLRTLREIRTLLARELGLDPGAELVALEQAILTQDPAVAGPTPLPSVSAACPYPGLLAYQVDDADVFFGRNHDVAACLDRLREARVLAVVGPSGCGKSSLVRAGLSAALQRDGTQVVVLTPGRRPLDVIAEAQRIRNGAVLVVDQLEAAFAQLPEAAQQVVFLDGLLEQATCRPLVLCLRVDRMGGLAVHPAFTRLVERGLYFLGGMGPEDLRAAIEGPARQAGLQLEPGLVDLLVRELEGQPGALPMMSHALRACWERREGRTLTVAGYAATGGIREAVARSAEAVYEQVGPAERVLVRDLMLRLVMPGREGEPVRSQLPRRLVVADAEHDRLIELLVEARLVTSGDDSLELAHEALARAWPRLRRWLDDDVEGHRILRHLAGAADAWLALGKPESELYRGVRLAAAREWRVRAQPDLTENEQEFLESSEALEAWESRSAEERVRHERLVNRRLRVLLAGVLGLLLVALLAGWGAQRQARRAAAATTESVSRLAGARGLLTEQPDRGVLLALAGVRLDDSAASRANLLAVLSTWPQLIGAARVPGGPLWGLEVSPDGRTLATYDDHNEVWLLDAATRQVEDSFDADGGRPQIANWPGMSPLAFSPDGRTLAVGKVNLDRESLVLLDTEDYEPGTDRVGGLPSWPSLVNDVRFSADGTRLAAAFIHFERGSDHPDWKESSVLVWDTADLSRPVNRIRLDGAAGLLSVAFGADADMLWVMRDRGGVSRLTRYGLHDGDRETPTDVSLPIEAWSVSAVRSDQRQLAMAEGKVGLLMDARSGRVTRLTGHSTQIDDLAYSSDGRLLATGADDGSAIVWDTRTGRMLERFETPSPSTYGVRLSPDGSVLYTVGVDRQVQAWDVQGGSRFIPKRTLLAPVELGGWILPSPSGDHVAYAWQGDGGIARLRFTDLRTRRASRLVDTRHATYGAFDWSPDGRLFATTGGDGVVRVWTPEGREVRHRKVAPGHLSGLQYVDGGRTIVVSERKGTLRWLDAATLNETRTADVGELVLYIAATGNGRRVLAVQYVTSGPEPNETYAPADRWALADAKTGDVRHGRFAVGDATSAGFSPDGTRIAVGGTDGRVLLMDADTGALVAPPAAGHDALVTSVKFDPSGRHVVTAGSDGSVSQWDGRSGELLGTVSPTSVAVAAQPLADGRKVLIADSQGTVFSWDVRPEQWIAFGCRLAGRDLTASEWTSVFGTRDQVGICPVT